MLALRRGEARREPLKGYTTTIEVEEEEDRESSSSRDTVCLVTEHEIAQAQDRGGEREGDGFPGNVRWSIGGILSS